MSAIENTNILTNTALHDSIERNIKGAFASVYVGEDAENGGISLEVLVPPVEKRSFVLQWPIREVYVGKADIDALHVWGGPANILVNPEPQTAETWRDSPHWDVFDSGLHGELPFYVAKSENVGTERLQSSLSEGVGKRTVVSPNTLASVTYARETGRDRRVTEPSRSDHRTISTPPPAKPSNKPQPHQDR